MKRFITLIAAAAIAAAAFGQTPKHVKIVYTEAADIQLVGKIFTDTPNPYHRVDTVKYKGFTTTENFQVRMSSGVICAFKTNSTVIRVKTTYGQQSFPTNTNGFSARGYDLYIRNAKGDWQWASSICPSNDDKTVDQELIKDMDRVEHECLLYLPLYSEVNSVKVGIEEGATIEGIVPFRHRVAIFGSSYTHGSSTSRAGMTYPAQFARATGIQLLSLGCSGNCKLQDYFCTALCDAKDIDAFVFDSFSNPSAAQMEERLFPFIERLQAAHPGVPLIFQRTIVRENRFFSNSRNRSEAVRMHMADSLMNIACKRYKDVYYIYPDASAKDHNATVDGVHPDNHGYSLWAESIQKPLCRILRKYGIR